MRDGCDNAPMSDQQVREEAIANITTGNAVTVSGLLWTFYLLAQHPSVESRLHQELDAVLAKVAQHGRSSLSEREQKILMRASELYRQRRK